LAKISTASVILINKAIAEPIRNMNPDDFINQCSAKITYILATYCGYKDEINTSFLVTECNSLMWKKFGHLCIDEIDEAFRLNAARIIAGNAIAYGGTATVIGFGDVISHYNEYRNKAAFLLSQPKAPQVSAEDEEKARSVYIEMVKEWFSQQQKIFTIRNFYEIPHYYCQTLEDLELISFEPFERQSYVRRALIWIQESIKNKVDISSDRKRDYFKVSALIENGGIGLKKNPDINAEATMVAKSMAVYEKVKKAHEDFVSKH
jgi:hypothetical protein